MVKISSAIKNLNRAYLDGAIGYPRVNNNYILDTHYTFYPHPNISTFDIFSKPLTFKEYQMTKDTILLFLNEKNYITPSKIQNSYQLIEKYFNNKLQPRKVFENKIQQKVEVYEEFLQKHDINDFSHSSKVKDSKYFQSPMTIYPFEIKLTPTMQSKREKFVENTRQRVKKTDDNSTKRKYSIHSFKKLKEISQPVNNINQALEQYHKLRRIIFINEIAEKSKKLKEKTERVYKNAM